MRLVTWGIRLFLFLLLAALAAKNLEPVTLRFFFDLGLQAPLVVMLFAAFALGALLGMLALAGPLLRRRREIALLKKPALPSDAPPAPSL
jgi:uncharacterized integral membrane protein